MRVQLPSLPIKGQLMQEYDDMVMISKLYNLAAMAHAKQQRDDGTPFITHPIAVAEATITSLADMPGNIGAYSRAHIHGIAIVHDVPEDCEEYWTNNIMRISPIVYRGAMQLRNPSKDHKDKSRDERKLIDRNHFADLNKVDDANIIVKYHDRIHNIRSSACWAKARRLGYIDETRVLADVLLRRVNTSSDGYVYKLGRNLDGILREELKIAFHQSHD